MGLGAVAGELAAAEPAPADPRIAKLRLSTSSVHFKGLPLEQACERIARLGFTAVDIWCAYEGCPHLDDALQRLGPEGLKDVLARNGLRLFAFSTYIGGYAKYAELLGKAGGGVAVQGSAGPCAPAELTARMKAFLEGLKPLVELAERHQSRLAIENHGQSLLDGLDSFKAFTDLNASPRLGRPSRPTTCRRWARRFPKPSGSPGRNCSSFTRGKSRRERSSSPGTGRPIFGRGSPRCPPPATAAS